MAWLEDFKSKREERRVDSLEKKRIRSEKVSDRRTFRLDKIHAIKDKFYAVAAKRKWLFFIIAAAIVAYLVIFKGGFSFGGGSGILEKIKGFF
jgi:hypothetical protein|tara:strand:+ start:214 stop:492 length:279 start_codon:yes stop_codon:yes gene_type:complete